MVEPANAMPLTAGTRLGPYEILSTLGAGGMGEVYRARDTSLRRDVAIKILPAMWAADPDRLQRFEREAQLLASLNHPHIGAIYGLESTPGQSEVEHLDGPDIVGGQKGGTEPAWARGTGELFYRQGDAVMAVEVKTAPALQVGKPRRLFAGHYSRVGGVFANYDVTADGQRFLMVRSGNQEAATRINIVVNWFEDVKRLLTAH
jgi:serine/threonine protein kinase